MRETWRVVNDYPNYSISDLGNIKNNNNNQLKKTFQNSRGYLTVSLYKNNVQKKMSIHYLVASHFLPNWNNYKEVDHQNRIKTDNRVINLRWCSRSDNLKNKHKKLGCSSKYKGVSLDKRRGKWVAEIVIYKKKKFIGYFETEENAFEAWKRFVIENNLAKFYINDLFS